MADLFRVIVAIFIPPLAVFLQLGFNVHVLINIVLCFLGFIPGLIHALWVILDPAFEQIN